VPTANDLAKIEIMSGYWLPQHYQATLLDVPIDVFRKAAREDPLVKKALDKGKALGADKLHRRAFEMAIEDRNPTMMIFALKAQENWRDGDSHNVMINAFNVKELPSMEDAVRVIEASNQRKCIEPVKVEEEP
jgi:hypothetical protein